MCLACALGFTCTVSSSHKNPQLGGTLTFEKQLLKLAVSHQEPRTCWKYFAGSIKRTLNDVGDQVRVGVAGLGEWGVVGCWSHKLVQRKGKLFTPAGRVAGSWPVILGHWYS